MSILLRKDSDNHIEIINKRRHLGYLHYEHYSSGSIEMIYKVVTTNGTLSGTFLGTKSKHYPFYKMFESFVKEMNPNNLMTLIGFDTLNVDNEYVDLIIETMNYLALFFKQSTELTINAAFSGGEKDIILEDSHHNQFNTIYMIHYPTIKNEFLSGEVYIFPGIKHKVIFNEKECYNIFGHMSIKDIYEQSDISHLRKITYESLSICSQYEEEDTPLVLQHIEKNYLAEI